MQLPQITLDDYLLMEEHAETKHEYWDGHVVDMAGAAWAHNMVASNVEYAIRRQLSSHCRSARSDLRVRIGTRYAYPDVIVVCGEPHLTNERPESLLNPTLIVEVTSESTVAIDKGSKFDAYREIESLVEYWILDYEDRRALQCLKSELGWEVRIHGNQSLVRSERLGIEIPLDDVFAI